MAPILLLCIIPAALCAPALEERSAVGDFWNHLTNPFQLDSLKCDVQLIFDKLGKDPAEQACETECHKLLMEGHILNYGCPLVCHGFQNMVKLWHIVPDTTDPAASKCHNALSHIITTTVPTTTV